MNNLKRLLLNNLLVLTVAAAGWPIEMSGGNFVMTKDLVGAAGTVEAPTINSVDYSLSFAFGESVAGDVISEPTYQIISGYYGGRFGNSQTFQMLSSQVGAPGVKTFYQGQLQVGVPFTAPVKIAFSDQLTDSSILTGIHVVIASDHLENDTNLNVPYSYSSDPTAFTVTLTPQGGWVGNTLYDVQITAQLQNIDGSPLAQTYHIYFVTMLDLHQDNIVSDPLTAPGLPASVVTGPISAMSIHIPSDSLSDYSAVLSSRDPLTTPLHVDPSIIREADAKALASGGAYRIPLAIQEINAYNTGGALMGPLSKPAELTIDYGSGAGAPSLGGGIIRPQSLALYVLDETHRLWVKIPASQNSGGFHTVSAPVTSLSVFALMGSADGSAADSFAFPNPWRPHGPNAGNGSGQTGTESGGITFNVLPSECTIKIYTISGDLVRQIQHSDIGGQQGQETWDVKTTHGDPVASGVYLWRVESNVDGKNGKLMIIR